MSKCTRLGTFAQNEELDAASSEVRSAAARGWHERKRLAALDEVAKWSNGAVPMAGLSEGVLEALRSRGFVERRYVLTRDGRAAVERRRA